MSSQSVRFATAVLGAFEAAGAVTDAEVGRAGGPSTTTMTKLRKAALGELDMAEPRNDTFRRIEAVAGWPSGSARTLWRDGVRPVGRRASGLESLGLKPARVAPVGGIDGYLRTLADRITELEERVDLLEATGGRASERSTQPDLVLDRPDGETVVEVKSAGAASAAAARQGELYAIGADTLTGLGKGYVGALIVASHENPVVAGGLNERLAQHGRVDAQLVEQARSVIGAVRALEDPRVVVEVLVQQFDTARRELSEEDREFLDGIAATMPESDADDDGERFAKAARTMKSAGRAARAAQDAEAEAGDAWQDDGGEG